MATFKGRICVLSVYRNTDPAQPLRNHHLALCDGATVVSPDDFVFYNQHPQGGPATETFHMDPHNHDSHRWYYFPGQKADEALLVTQFDSDPEASPSPFPSS